MGCNCGKSSFTGNAQRVGVSRIAPSASTQIVRSTGSVPDAKSGAAIRKLGSGRTTV